MANILNRLALASQRAPGLRSFQQLSERDLPRLDAFFLSFDFDQRRAFFGGGVSDQSIRQYCRAIDWTSTTMIARSGPYCLEAIAMLVSLPPDHATVEFTVGCPLYCDQQPIMAEFLSLAIEIATLGFRKLLVRRELANPDLLCLLRGNDLAQFDSENVQVDMVMAGRLKTAAWLLSRALQTDANAFCQNSFR